MNKEYFSLMEQLVPQTNKEKKHSMFKELKGSRQGWAPEPEGQILGWLLFHQLVPNFVKALGP